MEKRSVKRGEIYLYDFGCNCGSVQDGIRPVMVIQANEFNCVSPTTVVAAITSVLKKTYLPTHIYLGQKFGLDKSSILLLEQLQTVNQNELTRYIGKVKSKNILRSVDKALSRSIGAKVKEKTSVKCLCPQCLKHYLNDPEYLIKRKDPFESKRGICCNCGREGWSYIIYPRTQRKENKNG